MTAMPSRRKRSRGRRLAGVAAALGLAAVLSLSVLLLVDIYLHGRFQRSAGFNVWGYRGPVASRKKPNEYRVVVLGGSAAYGYGVSADEAFPAVLERLLRVRTASPLFTVVNLAYNNEGTYSFRATLQDYGWLNYDLALLYEGYNDLMADEHRPNVQVFRHDSPVFRLTGYMPIFPIIFKEKAGAMLHGGDVGAQYRRDDKTVFHANVATKAAAGMLQATAAVAQSLETQLGRVSVEPVHRVVDAESVGCRWPWQPYCQSMAVAIEYARRQGRQVLVGTQPYVNIDESIHDRHLAQQDELRALLGRRFGNDAGVGYVNLGDRVDLENRQLSFDHMHLTESGNEQLAGGLVDAVIDMAMRKQKTS
jgi:hypothetical protein